MQLYNLTLQKATNINHAVHGNYSGQKQKEIAVSRGTVIEILKECFMNLHTWQFELSILSVKLLEFSVFEIRLKKDFLRNQIGKIEKLDRKNRHFPGVRSHINFKSIN